MTRAHDAIRRGDGFGDTGVVRGDDIDFLVEGQKRRRRASGEETYGSQRRRPIPIIGV